MVVAVAELSVSALADICINRPQISTQPLESSEYYPPGTSRTSKIRTGVDAEWIYNATAGQRAHILKQLEEAEGNARDALFALEMMEMELAHKTTVMKSTLCRLSGTLPPHEFEEMCEFAFGQSKKDWEQVWKHEWIEDGTERNKFIRPRGPSKRQPPLPLSSPLPPSSPSPPTSPLNLQYQITPQASLVHTNETPIDELPLPTRSRSPPIVDGFRAPQGFVDTTRYQPTQPQQARRLTRDLRRLEVDRNGTLVLVDTMEEIEAHRRQMRARIRQQAQRDAPAETETSLMRIVQSENIDDRNRMEGQPVTWSRVFENDEAHPDDLTNPFAQDDHVGHSGLSGTGRR